MFTPPYEVETDCLLRFSGYGLSGILWRLREAAAEFNSRNPHATVAFQLASRSRERIEREAVSRAGRVSKVLSMSNQIEMKSPPEPYNS